MLAPSSHNSQPWRFRLIGEVLELLADRARALPVVDPDDRELTLSWEPACGSSRWRLPIFGEGTSVSLLPNPGDPDLLARIELTGRMVPAERDHALFSGIRDRRTNRHPFSPDPIPEAALARARAQAERQQTWLQTLTAEADRNALAELIAEGHRTQLADRRFRRELAAWVHSNRSSSRDGMPGFAHGVGTLVSEVGPLIIRTFDIGDGKAARDRDLALGSPALAVLWTEDDTLRAWLRAGLGLAGVLLSLAGDGISSFYLNQAMEVPELRARVGALLGREGAPQLVFRLGRGKSTRPTPRRGVDEVLFEG